MSFAYPFGANTAHSVGLVRSSGFECACATVAGPVDANANRFQLPRVQVCNWDEEEFYHRLKGWLEGSKDSAVWAVSANDPGVKQVLIRGKWDFRVDGGNAARLLFPYGNSDHPRIEIDAVVTPTEFEIQLNLPRLSIKSGCACEVIFRARSDAPRKLAVGFAQAHEPWSGLGLYAWVELNPEWRSFHLPFLPTADEDDARIHFDAGGDPVSVEVADVALHWHDSDREF